MPGIYLSSLRVQREKGENLVQSGEPWPLEPRRLSQRDPDSKFLQVRMTQQVMRLHLPYIFIHGARARHQGSAHT